MTPADRRDRSANHDVVPLELLDLSGHRRGVDAEHLGKIRHPERVTPGRQFVEQGHAGTVDPDAGRTQEPLVQADLGDRPSHDLEDLGEPFDVAHGRAGAGGRRWRRSCCFSHTTIIPSVGA